MRLFLFVATLIFTTVSCKKEISNTQADQNVSISTTKADQSLTNAPAANASYFDVGELIGIYINSTDLNGADVQKYVENKDAISEAKGGLLMHPYVPYITGRKLNIYGYYPYRPGGTINTEFMIQTQVDQFSPESFKEMDFLSANALAVEMSKNSIPLSFEHKNCKINIILEKGLGVYDWSTVVNPVVSIVDAPHQSAFNILTNKMTPDFSSKVNVAPAGILELDTDEDVMKGLSVILPPRVSADEPSYIQLQVGSEAVSSVYRAAIDGDLESGYEYNYRIKVTRNGVVPGQVTINKWVQGTDANIDSKLWATSKFKFILAPDVIGKQIGTKVVFTTHNKNNSTVVEREVAVGADGAFSLVTPINLSQISKIKFLSDDPFVAVVPLQIKDVLQEVTITQSMIQ